MRHWSESASALSRAAMLCVAALLVSTPAQAQADAVAATVEIRAQGRSLQARYTLPSPATRLPLKRDYSAELRRRIWQIRTPGVRLEGNAFVGDHPFSTAEIRAEALAEPVPKDYAPLAPFSDGGVAVYTGLFDAGEEKQRTRYRFVPADGEGVVLSGRMHHGPVDWLGEADGDGTYVYFGRSVLVPSGAGLAVLDRGLPFWIIEEIDATFPKLVAYYTDRFGRPPPFTPFVLFSFNGSDAGGTHSQGSVLPGLLYMRLDGSAWAKDTADSRDGLRWTLAHEAAHFWNLANRDPDGAQWLHEGSADAFAYRALQALGYADAAAAAAKYDEALAACLLDLGDEAVNSAERAGDGSLSYSCGLVMALYTEAALKTRQTDADLFTFWRALLDEAGDAGYTQALYLATLAALTGTPQPAAWLAQFADHRADERAALPAAFARVGLPLQPIDGDVGDASARRIYGRLIQQLMAADCGGHHSFTLLRNGLRIHGGNDCQTLKQDIDVRSIDGRALFDDPLAAYAAVQQRCLTRETVRLGDGTREWALPCATRIAALPALFRLDRSAVAQSKPAGRLR